MDAKQSAEVSDVHDYDRLGEIYSEQWYSCAGNESLDAGRIMVAYLRNWIQPRSVLDIGCGRGDWLKAWREHGVELLVGMDGHWNRQELMVEPSIRFSAVDLNRPIEVARKFDLTMTLEVAEHLEVDAAGTFVESLARTSDLVLFGAAYPHQGGQNHLNERPHSYWAERFAVHGFVPFDVLRPVFWGDARIPFWYRQNSFLYSRVGSEAFDQLVAQEQRPMQNIGFMDCVHPVLYDSKLDALRKLHDEARTAAAAPNGR